MKQFLVLIATALLVFAIVGCSDDNPPVSGPANTATSVWNAAGGYWNTSVDATDANNFSYFSFATQDTVSTGTPKLMATNSAIWDLGLRREVIKTNGGTSTENNGDIVAVSLGAVTYADVTIDDTVGVNWTSDFIDHFIDEWYNYNTQTHQLSANQFVYSMIDASGEHYVKFQVDSMVGAAQPPDMGTVYIKYYYQDTANSLSLAGTPIETAISVGAEHAYFDFSTGAEVNPANPANSLEWDIDFYAYEISQNSGPNGSGACAAFPAFTELTDSTDINELTAQPSGAPLFADIAGSALTDWYTYTGPPNHQLFSNSDVYLIKTGSTVYKLKIESYYGENGDKPGANYNFIWSEL